MARVFAPYAPGSCASGGFFCPVPTEGKPSTGAAKQTAGEASQRGAPTPASDQIAMLVPTSDQIMSDPGGRPGRVAQASNQISALGQIAWLKIGRGHRGS